MGHKAIFNGQSLGNRIDSWYGNGGVIYDFSSYQGAAILVFLAMLTYVMSLRLVCKNVLYDSRKLLVAMMVSIIGLGISIIFHLYLNPYFVPMVFSPILLCVLLGSKAGLAGVIPNAMLISGLAAGAATVGCCANMIGFAVISFRENKVGGLISQGIGTSMLQMPNIIKRPVIWLPAIISSAILGPISTMLVKMTGNPVGSGMGTSGLVGPIQSFMTMTAGTDNVPAEAPWVVVIKIVVMYFVLPALISLACSEPMRKLNWIRQGDLSLNV